jgi:nucleotide-binding universal stress UspA family protein
MKVIAALDTSPVAPVVMGTARVVAARLAAELHALHARRDGAARMPRRIAETAARHGADLVVVEGRAIPAIIDVAGRGDVVVVIGVRSTPHGKLPAGHTALAVAAGTRCPVVVTPPTGPITDIRRMLVPLEGLPDGDATALLARFADHGVEIVPLHVFMPSTVPSFWDQPHHAAPAWSADFLSRFGPRDAHDLWLRSGDVADAVLEVVDSAAIDLVALTWSQDLSDAHAPVVRAVLAWSPVPVLLVPVHLER